MDLSTEEITRNLKIETAIIIIVSKSTVCSQFHSSHISSGSRRDPFTMFLLNETANSFAKYSKSNAVKLPHAAVCVSVL